VELLTKFSHYPLTKPLKKAIFKVRKQNREQYLTFHNVDITNRMSQVVLLNFNIKFAVYILS